MIIPPDVRDDHISPATAAPDDKPYYSGREPISTEQILLMIGLITLLCMLPLFWSAITDAFR